MTSELRRLAMLLAGSGLAEKQIEMALREVDQIGLATLMHIVQFLREQNRRSLGEASVVLDSTPSPPPVGSAAAEDAVVFQVEHLLRREANLPIAEAAHELVRSLSREVRIPMSYREVPEKMGGEQFRRWLGRLLELAPARVLLHHATRVRNRLVHSGATDWPLKGSE